MRRRLRRLKKHHIKELALLCGALLICALGILLLWVSSFNLPDLSTFSTRKVSQSTKIYDRTGEVLLYDVNQGVRRTIIADSEISRNIKNATVAIEDSDFYEHRGIRPMAFLRAVLVNLGSGRFSQGGSTITQQVVKNALLTTEKKISRKLKEWILALRLEKVLSKTEILDIYLNEAPYGSNIYGIEEASQTFFGKKAADLSLGEAAYLAALPNAPSYYSPYGNNKPRLEERKNLVLAKMLEKEFISKEEYAAAKAETVVWKPQGKVGIKAPHFVMYVKQYLEEKYGSDVVAQGGLKVITSLDYGLQEKAEAMAKEYATANEKNFNAENLSLVAMDPKTGQILVMVGSRDYFDKEIDGNFNVSLAHRQPGSSFKPIVYAEALNKGYTPKTVVFDIPTEFSTECNVDGTPLKAGDEEKCYMPENFDGKYLGPINLKNALAQSRNIPAIQVFYLAGLKDALHLAKDMGIGSLTNIAQYGLTLVLGGGEVSLLDMTGAYSVFAANGMRNPYSPILKVEDQSGNVLESFESHPIQVLPEQTALQINDILSDNAARAPEFGEHSALYIEERPVASKTGTTNDYRDAWILGYSPNLVVGAWAGNNDNSPMVKKIAGFIVAPFWNAFTREALKQFPVENFKKPAPVDESALKPILRGLWQGGQSYVVDRITGERATELTPPELREERVVRQIHSILYWVDKKNPTGPPPAHPEDDPQFKYWEYAVRKWAGEGGLPEETSSVIPTATDSAHQKEFAPQVSIVNPLAGVPYRKDQNITVAVNVTGRYPITKVDYFINGSFIGSSAKYPWSLSFLPASLDNLSENNELQAVAYDSVLNRGESRRAFRVAF